MQKSRFNWVVPAVMALIPVAAPAATARFEITTDKPKTNGEVVVAPGEAVPYQIRVLVTSDDPAAPDNNGLSFFSVDVLTNLGVTQQPALLEAAIGELFNIVRSNGTPMNDDLVQVGGGQNTFTGGATPGIGVGAAQLLAAGQLTTPASEGQFTVSLSGSANVLRPGSTMLASAATFIAGDPLIIRTAVSSGPPPGDDNNGGNGGDDGGDDDDGSEAPTPPRCAPGLNIALMAAFGLLAVVRWTPRRRTRAN